MMSTFVLKKIQNIFRRLKLHNLTFSFFFSNRLFFKVDNSDKTGVLRRITKSLRQSDFYVDPWFNLVIGLHFAFLMVYCGWHSFLVPHALQRGISARNTIFMALSAAIGNTISRAVEGVLANMLFKPVTLYLFATIPNIAALLCDVYFVNYYAMLVTTCISAMS